MHKERIYDHESFNIWAQITNDSIDVYLQVLTDELIDLLTNGVRTYVRQVYRENVYSENHGYVDN